MRQREKATRASEERKERENGKQLRQSNTESMRRRVCLSAHVNDRQKTTCAFCDFHKALFPSLVFPSFTARFLHCLVVTPPTPSNVAVPVAHWKYSCLAFFLPRCSSSLCSSATLYLPLTELPCTPRCHFSHALFVPRHPSSGSLATQPLAKSTSCWRNSTRWQLASIARWKRPWPASTGI